MTTGRSGMTEGPEQVLQRATRIALEYEGTIRDRPVNVATTSQSIRELLDPELPEQPCDAEQVIGDFERVLLAHSRHNAHPRMFGYVQSSGIPIAAAADLLASTLNANVTAWRSAPAATEIERLTIDWIKQILGYPMDSFGLFVSGGSMANLCGLAAARAAKASIDVRKSGAQGLQQPMCVYASQQTHHSVVKAAGILGIGQDNVRLIPVDDRFHIDLTALERTIETDKAAGYQPFCVVGNGGTVNTGAFDPLKPLSEIAWKHGLWLHVDGSYGGFAALSSTAKPLFEGLAEADSVALDPHKWLYLPLDCGCVLYRRAEDARRAFAHEAEYTRVWQQAPDEAFAFWDFGPELSRRFRALKVWMTLRMVGTKALGESIESNIQCARLLESLVNQSEDLQMLAPVKLSIFCFRYLAEQFRGRPLTEREEADVDSFNERLMVALQADGSSYVSNARLRGRFALRGCVLNYRTTEDDMRLLVEDVRRVASTLNADYPS